MLRVARSTVAELLTRSVEQGEGLLERANLIGDFSDYESWKGNRKVWIERTAETLHRVYDGPQEAEDFRAAVSSEVPSPRSRRDSSGRSSTAATQTACGRQSTC